MSAGELATGYAQTSETEAWTEVWRCWGPSQPHPLGRLSGVPKVPHARLGTPYPEPWEMLKAGAACPACHSQAAGR